MKLITGGNGMVGSHIKYGFKPTSSEMDIRDPESIHKYLENKTISCIIHLAAVNLRESENNPQKAIDVNINGTINMLRVAMKLDIPFVVVSTGAVFSAFKDEVFNEESKKCPNCLYGLTKSTSEEISLLYPKTIIIRTGWLFGGNQGTHYKFVENVIANIMAKQEIKASCNFFGSPTYVVDFIEHMEKIIDDKSFGIHHIVNDGYASGYDIAVEISNIFSKGKELIKAVESHLIPNSGPKRSLTEKLVSIHSKNQLRNWKDALHEYVSGKYLNKFKKWSNREMCRLCGSYDLFVFFKLEPTPPANHFVEKPTKQETIPLDICICQECKHIQLIQIVDPDFQYSKYFYVSSTSTTMVKHLQDSVSDFTKALSKTDSILEIGANDGVCIKHLLENGFKNVIGIDPAANINKRHDLPIICDFFGSKSLDKFKDKMGYFKLIYAFHCCAHIEDIKDVFETVVKLLENDGIFIMEVGYFYQVFKKNTFDVIYHEHIDYHTCTAINKFAHKCGLKLYKVSENDIQGGSIQFFICKKENDKQVEDNVSETIKKEHAISLFDNKILSSWKNVVIRNGNDISYILEALIDNGKKIVGYGASAKSTTFIYQYKLTNSIIKYIIDDNVYKQNMYTPGSNIPIKPLDTLDIDQADYVIILSTNFSNELIKNLEQYRNKGLRIIIPFPQIVIC